MKRSILPVTVAVFALSLLPVAFVATRNSQPAAALTAPPGCQGHIPVPPRLAATATATAPLSTRPTPHAPIVLFAYGHASSSHSHVLSDTSCLSQFNFVASFLFLPSFLSQYFFWRIPVVAHTGPFRPIIQLLRGSRSTARPIGIWNPLTIGVAFDLTRPLNRPLPNHISLATPHFFAPSHPFFFFFFYPLHLRTLLPNHRFVPPTIISSWLVNPYP